ncbi:probable multidrug resistance-associated protein lethal(2)03659 [Microplitis demolitor]|uniref:probable multidrug resistance-associated protein lethal(2)03659 n=1 Tax=Microplitis demolitor TaxID=69319 RepID=UPI0006D50AD0|nr:probable multidrug resistance-associated protein lethal(2)03659 [Microplitis demolitor]XP_053594487.1 probable multidrug resistance-associated protein lethal(2)03659 [Microplitis demolitor]XP_053594488.1 probable multidrug resistance-associated protein lethal(2)03659 [Microplitis demolitor]XP_053594489.1 probable multidrug resistance-associated protein lethal(2)03659 [Microplitis demolitor]XP_053594490.1 probable multidrug resistance-associated protein lethal(2)03659 [Microplitis demolitor]
MDSKVDIEKKKNPREGINPLNALTFSWVLKIFWEGYKRDLEITDLHRPLKEHKSSILGDKLAAAWDTEVQQYNGNVKSKKEPDRSFSTAKVKHKKGKTPSLQRALIKVFGARIALYGVALAIMELVLRMLQPVALARLLRFFTSSDVSKTEAFLYAGGVILCSAVNILVAHPYMMAILHMGMKLRVACCSLIYRKSLKLSRTALGETTVGQAVNLLSNDVNRFDVAVIFIHYLWIGPVETIIITYLMYLEVGVAAIIGVASLLMFIPLQGWLGKKSSTLRLRTAIRTDERVRLTNEIISGIQAIKMYTWEHPFSNLIENARKREMRVVRYTSFIRGVIMSFIMFTTRLSLFLTILAYVLSDKQITAETVFMLTAYYNILRQTMTVFFPQGITQVAEASVSIKRLQNFLLYDEIETSNNDNVDNDQKKNKKNSQKNNISSNDKDKKEDTDESLENLNEGSITLDNVYAKWLDSDHEDTLKGINIHIKPGQLVAVVGQVGSGKTSLLNAILKELPAHTGSIDVGGKIAYASQEPWLFAGSVRQNILFGRPWDARKYDKVVKVCQLKRDFSLFPYGDKTIVGERGVSLSGGQRARINLARAVYSDAPIFLLDDPLSAVDAHVGKHMFEECVEKYLNGKTRILVTHQIQFLSNVEKIIVMKDGAIIAEGSYNKLVEMGVDFGRLLDSAPREDAEDMLALSGSRSNSRHASVTSLSSFMTNETTGQAQAEPEEVAEMRTRGSIGGHVYSSYFKAGGNCCLIFMVIVLFVGAQLAASGGDFFVAFWVNLEQDNSNNFTFSNLLRNSSGVNIEKTSGISEQDRYICIYIFTALTVLTVVITLMRSFAFFELCVRASKRLHDTMFRSISRATMRFFNTNTSGRVLNRFSKDMGAIDELLPIAMIDCIQIGLSLIGIIVVVSSASEWLLIPTAIIGVIFYGLRVIYISTSRSIKRLEGITRSPVFNHLSATLQGLPTIRSFNAEEVLTKEFDHHQDLHSSAWYIFIASSRAFGFWLDIFCLIYIACVTMSFLLLSDDEHKTFKGGNVGLAITQSIGLTGMFQWGMRQSAEVENQMTSVERVLEYTNIESEPALESLPEKKPKDDWPSRGKVEFKRVYLAYSPLEPPVLRNLNFTIEPREKIGIVGRTGAGKSSLIAALFRLAEIEGNIEIDGVDTGEIGLHDFRAKISIIPQEPFLFSGTLRRNLDPFEQYPDSILWSALEDVELKEMGLEGHVNEGGTNLSVGQRQLVCLARAIVRNNKVLVLDEATANVDPRTDEFIQKAIRRKFADCTVLTIAHRLNTVMDSDRILVMDAGSAVEFDHPHILLQNEDGYLSKMVKETGVTMIEALKNVAKQNYELRNPPVTTTL